MSREKQIDEMAKLICPYPQCTYYNIIGGCEARECRIVDNAEKIYNAGYRKQSENTIELPCKIGDTVYAIRNHAGVKKIRSGKVSQMFYVGEEMQLCIVVSKVGRGTWGDGIFATEEEAQAVINERKRG